jgi:hypothetical protein
VCVRKRGIEEERERDRQKERERERKEKERQTEEEREEEIFLIDILFHHITASLLSF